MLRAVGNQPGRGIYLFVTSPPKRADLHRDGRYSLHASPFAERMNATITARSGT